MASESFFKCFKKIKVCNLLPNNKIPAKFVTKDMAGLKLKTVSGRRKKINNMKMVLQNLIVILNQEHHDRMALSDNQSLISGKCAQD